MLGVSVSRETLTPNAGYAVAILVRCAQLSLKLSGVPRGPAWGAQRAGACPVRGMSGAGLGVRRARRGGISQAELAATQRSGSHPGSRYKRPTLAADTAAQNYRPPRLPTAAVKSQSCPAPR